jgi:hypothetical protein
MPEDPTPQLVSAASAAQEEKEKVKEIYDELLVLSREAPTGNGYMTDDDKEVWEQYQSLIDDLIQVTRENEYSRYRIKVEYASNQQYVQNAPYRSKLRSLITRLHRKYFYNEPDLLDKAHIQQGQTQPLTITNNLSQQQNQHQYMNLTLFEIRDRIDQRLSRTTDEKEKTFLTNLKEQLSTITTILQLIQIFFKIAHQSGLDIPTANHVVSTLLA